MEALQAEITGKLQAGDELVIAGDVALLGTALLAEKEYSFLRQFFSEGFMQDARRCVKVHGIFDCADKNTEDFLKNSDGAAKESTVWKTAVEEGANALYAMKEGGVLSALWKMAEASQVGLTADLRKIPICQETIEICEKFDINPYRMLSQGAVLIGIRGGEALVQKLHNCKIQAAVIGQTNSGNDRLLYSGENARYLERPAVDEIRKLPWGSCILETEQAVFRGR